MILAQHQFTSEWANQTTVHPVGVAVLLILGLAVFLVPRRLVVVPFLVMACAVPQAQRIVVLTLDFDYLRILALLAVLRVIVRGESAALKLHRLDWLITAIAVATISLPAIRTGGNTSVLINLSGLMFDMLAMYFVVRSCVRGWADIRVVATTLAVISIPMAVAFAIESATGRNLFAALGGVPELTQLRQGRMRCQGPFSHPILAGCFWAASFPAIAMLWSGTKTPRYIVAAALSACVCVIVLSGASTPIFGLAAAVFAMAMFHWRAYIGCTRWCVLFGAIALHLVMTKPVWHLFARVSFGGSTGWHRYYLIDRWIANWKEWFLIGSDRGAAHWGPGLYDVTNHYIIHSMRGGIILLGLVIVALVVAFQLIGKCGRHAELGRRSPVVWWNWCIGACLFVHVLCLSAVSYFGQIQVHLYLMTGLVGCIGQFVLVAKERRISGRQLLNYPSGFARRQAYTA